MWRTHGTQMSAPWLVTLDSMSQLIWLDYILASHFESHESQIYKTLIDTSNSLINIPVILCALRSRSHLIFRDHMCFSSLFQLSQ